MLNERGNIVVPFAQRGNPEGNHVEPVVEVFADLTFGQQLGDVAMSRGQEPHVERDRLVPTQAPHLVFLEDPQQVDLGLGGPSPPPDPDRPHLGHRGH